MVLETGRQIATVFQMSITLWAEVTHRNGAPLSPAFIRINSRFYIILYVFYSG